MSFLEKNIIFNLKRLNIKFWYININQIGVRTWDYYQDY